MTITEQSARAATAELAARLGVTTRNDLVAFTARDSACPFVVVQDGQLDWIAVERGQELFRRSTRDLDEFRHWVALDATRSMASRWELDRRHLFPEGRDSRIGWLAKQVALLGRIDPGWAETFRAGIPEQCPGVRLEDVDAHPIDDADKDDAAADVHGGRHGGRHGGDGRAGHLPGRDAPPALARLRAAFGQRRQAGGRRR